MRYVLQTLGRCVVLVLLSCVPAAVLGSPERTLEFVGSTPAGTLPREFLGGLPASAPCHNITWCVSLSTNQTKGQSMSFKLTALYRVPSRANPNQSEDGPAVEASGTLDVVRHTRTGSLIYRLNAEKTRRSLSLLSVGEGLLHLLDADGTLMIGNGGWSYTLNRADHAEKPVEPSVAASAPDMSYKISPLAKGPDVFAVFEGRTPCHGIARQLKIPQHTGCTKVKWRVTLYHDPANKTPTTYKIEGSLHRRSPRQGTWSIVRGATTDPNATVYRLDATGREAPLFLLRADDNILFFLSQDREPMVGHAEFSYTLNRVLDR